MDIQLHNEYVYTRQLDLNLEEQRFSANLMYEFIKDNFTSDGKTDYNGHSTLTTKLFEEYNYLMYPVPGSHALYDSIKETFHACNRHMWSGEEPEEHYYIQCWLNFYRKGEFIDWHPHWPEEFNSWHGFYCVDVEPDSCTTYRVQGRIPEKDDIVIPSKDNLIVLSTSGRDVHRSSEWNDPDRARITIAFDIVPANKLFGRGWSDINHWIPI